MIDDTKASPGDYHTFYAAAHHDIWWAKEQLWTTTNSALALIGALVGAPALMYQEARDLIYANTWPFAIVATSLTLATSAYLARLHYDAVNARNDAAFLRARHKPMKDLYDALPKRREASSDAYRGIVFVIGLMLLLAVALGLALHILDRSSRLPPFIGIVEFLVAWYFLYLGVTFAAAETREP